MSVQPGLGYSNDLRVGRKMATFKLFFQLGRAKEFSAPLYGSIGLCDNTEYIKKYFRQILGRLPKFYS